jgi:hypothetical protein
MEIRVEGEFEQLRLTPSQLGGCSTAWYIICGRGNGVGGEETRALIITATSAMAAVLSTFTLCQRADLAVMIYIMMSLCVSSADDGMW